jgi:hypothetical protein
MNEKLPDDELDIFRKLCILLYADDTIILAESPHQLQKALDGMAEYCRKNKLKVNETKTKIVVFSRGKIRNIPTFLFNDEKLEVVHSYTYLGVTLNYNGKFKVSQKDLYDKASRAMFGLIAKCRRLKLPIDIQLKLFDNVVKPIMLYGCEVWGPYNTGIADKLQLRFLKIILSLKSSTTTVMVRGETACLPMIYDIKCRVLIFWLNLMDPNQKSKICKVMYDAMYNMFNSNMYKCPWIDFVKNSLDQLGLSYIFECQGKGINHNWFRNTIKLRMQDAYKQDWNSQVYLHDSCSNYRLYKSDFVLEQYLINLPWFLANSMLKFRTRNSPPPIAKRYMKKNYSENDFTNKQCPLCNDNTADEFHFIMKCEHFAADRKQYISKPTVPMNVNTFNTIMNVSNMSMAKNLARFMRKIISVLNALNK